MEFIIETNRIWYGGTAEAPLAYITFPACGEGIVDVTHTVVDPSLQGQGLAGRLTQAMADELVASGRKAKLTCSYAVKWFAKHEEYAGLVVE